MAKDRLTINDDKKTCSIKDSMDYQEVKKNQDTELYFTYSVVWEQSEIRWASRWDIYLNMVKNKS